MLFKENIHPHFLIEITEIEIEGPFILIFLSSSFFPTKPIFSSKWNQIAFFLLSLQASIGGR